MGFKIDQVITSDASDEDHPPSQIHVTGDSIVDRVSLTQGDGSVTLDLGMIADLVGLLEYNRVIR